MPPLPPPVRKAIRYLRDRDLPKFQVRVVPNLEDMGNCSKGPKLFTICLDRGLVMGYPEAAIYILIHEAAHVAAWDCVGGDHGVAFAVNYADLYRGWLIESA